MNNWLYIFCLLLLPQGLRAQFINTFAGNGNGGFGGDGYPATTVAIGAPGIGAYNSHGEFFFPVRTQNRVRMITPSGIITTVSGNGNSGFSGDGGLAVNAELNAPVFVTVDEFDNIFISDAGNNRIRKIDHLNGIITTIVGDGNCDTSGDGGLAVNASICGPIGLAFDSNGSLFIADYANHKIRKVTSNGIITTIAGTGVNGYSGDGGLALNAQLKFPSSLALDQNENLVIADWQNHRVRRIDFSNGNISTIVGTGIGSFSGDTGLAINAGVNPAGICFDKLWNLIIADYANHRIRIVSTSDSIFTIAGTGAQGYNSDSILAVQAQLYQPEGVCVDTCGNIYIADKGNRRIRKVTFNDSCGQTSTSGVALKAINGMELYPNPASGYITIHSGCKLQEISVRNSLGQQMLQAAPAGERTDIDISSLAPGFYFVTVTDVNGVRLSRKLLKE